MTVFSLGASSFGFDTNAIDLVWNPPETGAHHYRLEIAAFDSADSETTITYEYSMENSFHLDLVDGMKYEVRIQAVDAYGIQSEFSDTAIFSLADVMKATEVADNIPGAVSLQQNMPNPFNPSTTISYELPRESRVTLNVFNAAGQKVAELQNGMTDAGIHSVVWNAAGMPSGVYFYRLVTDGFSDSRKMMLLK